MTQLHVVNEIKNPLTNKVFTRNDAINLIQEKADLTRSDYLLIVNETTLIQNL